MDRNQYTGKGNKGGRAEDSDDDRKRPIRNLLSGKGRRDDAGDTDTTFHSRTKTRTIGVAAGVGAGGFTGVQPSFSASSDETTVKKDGLLKRIAREFETPNSRTVAHPRAVNVDHPGELIAGLSNLERADISGSMEHEGGGVRIRNFIAKIGPSPMGDRGTFRGDVTITQSEDDKGSTIERKGLGWFKKGGNEQPVAVSATLYDAHNKSGQGVLLSHRHEMRNIQTGELVQSRTNVETRTGRSVDAHNTSFAGGKKLLGGGDKILSGDTHLDQTGRLTWQERRKVRLDGFATDQSLSGKVTLEPGGEIGYKSHGVEFERGFIRKALTAVVGGGIFREKEEQIVGNDEARKGTLRAGVVASGGGLGGAAGVKASATETKTAGYNAHRRWAGEFVEEHKTPRDPNKFQTENITVNGVTLPPKVIERIAEIQRKSEFHVAVGVEMLDNGKFKVKNLGETAGSDQVWVLDKVVKGVQQSETTLHRMYGVNGKLIKNQETDRHLDNTSHMQALVSYRGGDEDQHRRQPEGDTPSGNTPPPDGPPPPPKPPGSVVRPPTTPPTPPTPPTSVIAPTTSVEPAHQVPALTTEGLNKYLESQGRGSNGAPTEVRATDHLVASKTTDLGNGKA